jgi:hypothetical protein
MLFDGKMYKRKTHLVTTKTIKENGTKCNNLSYKQIVKRVPTMTHKNKEK